MNDGVVSFLSSCRVLSFLWELLSVKRIGFSQRKAVLEQRGGKEAGGDLQMNNY